MRQSASAIRLGRIIRATIIIFSSLLISCCSAIQYSSNYEATRPVSPPTGSVTTAPATRGLASHDPRPRDVVDLPVNEHFGPAPPSLNVTAADRLAWHATLQTETQSEAQLEFAPDRVDLGHPSLAPIAHTRFCQQYPVDCAIRATAREGQAGTFSERRWSDLVNVNHDVNQAISPQPNHAGLLAKAWQVSPKSGDCNDYAVTKQHQLLERGWPSHALLLAEVVTEPGEHHLVLLVRTRDGDLVLDNMNPDISAWSQTGYQWLRVQSPNNPKFWLTVNTGKAQLTALGVLAVRDEPS